MLVKERYNHAKGNDIIARLKGIEDKLSALESAYRYLQADVAECKKQVSDDNSAVKNGKNNKRQ